MKVLPYNEAFTVDELGLDGPTVPYEELQTTQIAVRIAHLQHLRLVLGSRAMPKDLSAEQVALQAELDDRNPPPVDSSNIDRIVEKNNELWGFEKPAPKTLPQKTTKSKFSVSVTSY